MSVRARVLGSVGLLAAVVAGAWLLLRDEAPRAARPAPPAPRLPLLPPLPPPPAPEAPDPSTLARVEGTVRDALTGEALARVDVIFAGEQGETTGASGADGSYRVALAPGRYRVRAAGEELFGLAPEPLALEAGAVTRFDLRVARLATVAGRVVDAAGQPAPGALVTFESSLARESIDSSHLEPDGEARAGADGAFSLRVAPGEVVLWAERDGARGRRSLPSVVPAAQLAGVELVLPATAKVRGHVRDGARRPVAGALVRGGRGFLSPRTTSGPDGAFELTLPVGRAALQARAGGYADSAPVEVEVRAAGRDGVELTLGEGRAVSGRVLLPDGAPAAGAFVQAFPPRLFDPPGTRADASGTFVLEGLGDDPVDLVATLAPWAPARQKRVRAPRDDLVLKLAGRGRIVGRVTAGGAPVTSFTVRVDHWIPAGTDDRVDGGGVRRLAPDGSFVLDGLQPGTWDLVVSAPGHAPASRRGIVVRPGADADGSVELAAGASLEGTVRDARSGGPVAGARVKPLTGHEAAGVFTDEAGRFLLEDVAPGRRSLEIEHPWYVRRSESGLEARAGQRTRVDVALSPVEPGRGAARAVEFAGIGAVLTATATAPCIQGLLPGSPAQVAGLQVGDCITAIDGIPTGASLADAIEAIRGVAGTAVRLGIARAGATFTVDVVRGNVRYEED